MLFRFLLLDSLVLAQRLLSLDEFNGRRLKACLKISQSFFNFVYLSLFSYQNNGGRQSVRVGRQFSCVVLLSMCQKNGGRLKACLIFNSLEF